MHNSLRRIAAVLVATACMQACSSSDREFSPVMHGDTVIITGEPTCQDCQIVLSDSVSIGSDVDSVSLSTAIWAARRSDGHLFVTGTYGVFGVVEYDPTGKLLRVLGQQGGGPAEFGGQPSRPTLLRGDTLVVYDLKLRRFMRIGPDGTLLGPFAPSFRPWDITSTYDGLLLVTGAVPTDDPFEHGPPAHFLNLDGSIARSVGDSLGAVGADRSAAYKQVAISPSGAVALANFYGYDVAIHFSDGTRRVLSRRADWFTPAASQDEVQARLTELWFDKDERLWVTLFIPQKAADSAALNANDELQAATRAGDNIVEVFDSRSGELLASRRFTDPFFISNGLGIGPVERPSGLIGWTIWRPSLTISKE